MCVPLTVPHPCSKMNKSSAPCCDGGMLSPSPPHVPLSHTIWGILFHERQIILPRCHWMRKVEAAWLDRESGQARPCLLHEVSSCSPKRAGHPQRGGDEVQGPCLQAPSWWGARAMAGGFGVPLGCRAVGYRPCSPKLVPRDPSSPRAGLAPGVPLRSPAAEAVAALPRAVDEALSVLAFLLDGSIQNGLVQEVNLVDVPPCGFQR